jgi:ParB/RepB/Spo0J family partition protein
MPRRAAAATPRPDAVEESREYLPAPAPPAEYRLVPVAELLESPLNPRTHGRDEGLDELAVSIATHGVLEPLVVRPCALEPGKFEIVAGNRRFRASQRARRFDVPVTIRDVSDAQLVELALQENLHRANMHPLDEARAFNTLAALDLVYRDDRVLAAKIGRSETYVRDRRKLLRLDLLIVEAFDAGAITLRHAEVIARVPADQQPRALEECFAKLLVLGKEKWTPRSVAIEQRAWPELAQSLVGTRELERWVADKGKRDIAAPEVQEALRDAVVDEGGQQDDDRELAEGQIATALEEATESVLQLSDYRGYFSASAARDAKVVRRDDWKGATPGSCKFVRKGIVVHPVGAEPRVLDVCVSKACTKHHPKRPSLYSSRSAAMSPAEIEREKKRAAAVKAADDAWQALKPKAARAFAEHVKGVKFTADLVGDSVGSHYLARVKKVFGVALTNRTAAVVLLLSNMDFYHRDDFARATKSYGFDLAKFEKKVAPAKKAKK